MDELKQLKDKLLNERPAFWVEFPDIPLYKDQVVTYIDKQLIRFDDREQLTSAMINNYIKGSLLPRPEGKKYTKEHLAALIEICILKQVLSVGDTGFILQKELEGSNSELFYDKFREALDDSMSKTAEQLESNWSLHELSSIALHMAVFSYCYKLVCERMIEIIRSKSAAGDLKTEEKQAKKPEKKPVK
ncbi:MAG TPA: hypothetical protein DIW17_11550 [Clostridiales bacterium]|nr:DUF1836 domain-containing protein [Clostridia bacterium]HCS74493.1 hypothetical protein [Clostridiales bacterium]